MPKWVAVTLNAGLYIVAAVAFFGMWALPLLWAPLAVVPIAVLGAMLIGSFKANLTGRK